MIMFIIKPKDQYIFLIVLLNKDTEFGVWKNYTF